MMRKGNYISHATFARRVQRPVPKQKKTCAKSKIRWAKNMDDGDEIRQKILKCCEKLSKEAEELYVGSSVTELDGREPISPLEFYREASIRLHCKCSLYQNLAS